MYGKGLKMKTNVYLIEYFDGNYAECALCDTFLGINAYEAIGKLITASPCAKIQNIARVLDVKNGEIE